MPDDTIDAARAFWVTAPGVGEVRPFRPAPPGPDEVVVRTAFSAVSAGTERLVFRGQVPESQHGLMRAPFQQGSFPAPVCYGYAAVGEVVAGEATRLGETVFCLHPHASAFVVPATAAVTLPPLLPPARAVLAANMETALNAAWDAEPRPGERIAVVGAGVVGTLTAYVLRRFGHAPVVVDVDPAKAALARDLDLDFATPEAAGGGFEVIVHASGAPAGLVWSLAALAFEGRVIELSWYGETSVALPLGEAFHSRRLRLVSSQVGHVAPAMRGRVDHRGRLQRALALLDDPRLDRLIDADLDLDDLPAFMADLAAGRRSVLCARVHYR